MTVRRNFLNWGTFLICLGAVPLAVQLGVLDAQAAIDLIRLWPLILIGIGLGLLLRLTPYAALGGVVVAATGGLLIGTFLSGGVTSGGAIACTGDRASGPAVTRNGTMTGSMTLNAELTCADVEIGRTPGGEWTVEAATGGADPTISASGSTLTLRSREGFRPLSGQREVWRVTLPADAALSVSATYNAARVVMNAGDGPVGGLSATYNAVDALLDLAGATGEPSLSATLNASSLDLIMPAAASVNASVTLNAASLNVCTAPGTALRIDLSETLGSNNFAAAGLVRSGDAWQSPDFATAQVQHDLDVSANVSSMSINPAGGCQ